MRHCDIVHQDANPILEAFTPVIQTPYVGRFHFDIGVQNWLSQQSAIVQAWRPELDPQNL